MNPVYPIRLSAQFGRITCPRDWSWNTREQPLDDCDLWYVWGGEGRLHLNGNEYPLTKGSCFLFRPGDRTWATHNPNKPLALSYLHFDVCDSSMPLPKPFRELKDALLVETCLTLYAQLLAERPYRYEEEAELLVLLMLQRLRRDDLESEGGGGGTGKARGGVYRAVDYIRRHPETRHRIEELAERSGLSPKYFSSKFKEVMKVSAESFVIQNRIQRAEYMLRHDMSVAEVADALGYKNPYFFSRQFKKYRGIPPSEIKRSM